MTFQPSGQMEMVLERREVKVPTAPKTYAVLRALDSGKRLTVGKALIELGVYALSQEVGRLRKLGWKVYDRTVETSPGVHVKEYWR